MDTLGLVLYYRRNKSSLTEDEEHDFGSLEQLMMPLQEESHQTMNEFFVSLRNLFVRLSRGKESLSTGDFQKEMLANDFIVTTCGM